MRELILAAMLALGAAAAQAQGTADLSRLDRISSAEIIASAEEQHPAALYVLAGRLLAAGEGQEAAKWMYVAQLRYRILLAAGAGHDARVLFSALHEQVGRPVNEHIGGNVDEWLAAIDAALDWDAAHENAVNPKATHAAVIEQERQGLAGLRAQVEENRDQIPRLREENGLENR